MQGIISDPFDQLQLIKVCMLIKIQWQKRKIGVHICISGLIKGYHVTETLNCLDFLK